MLSLGLVCVSVRQGGTNGSLGVLWGSPQLPCAARPDPQPFLLSSRGCRSS